MDDNCADPAATTSKRSTKKRFMRRAKKVKSDALPRFPKKPDSMLNQEEVELRRSMLEKYLRAAMNHKLYRNHHEMVREKKSLFIRFQFQDYRKFKCYINTIGVNAEAPNVQSRDSGLVKRSTIPGSPGNFKALSLDWSKKSPNPEISRDFLTLTSNRQN